MYLQCVDADYLADLKTITKDVNMSKQEKESVELDELMYYLTIIIIYNYLYESICYFYPCFA